MPSIEKMMRNLEEYCGRYTEGMIFIVNELIKILHS